MSSLVILAAPVLCR